MIISLIGFMGCGKSSVGRKLSELLCCSFMDLDEVIVERAGRSVPEIFACEGESGFRQMELEALRSIVCQGDFPERSEKQSLPSQATGPSLCGQRGSTVFPTSPENPTGIGTLKSEGRMAVLATGGGAVMTPECAELIHNDTCCIYLRASVETLLEHLEGEADGRPMLAGSCHFGQAKRVGKSIDMKRRIETLMAQRADTYEKTAHIIIDTDGRSIETVAQDILSHINRSSTV